ncbi:MAG: hypothetical protein RLZZ453_656 [Chlamydiota bacterium]|jgi:predicted AAA+ superfamily ATPase
MALAILKRGCSVAYTASKITYKAGLAASKPLYWVGSKPLFWQVNAGVIGLGAAVYAARLFAENILKPIWSTTSAVGLEAYTLGEAVVTGIGNGVRVIAAMPGHTVAGIVSVAKAILVTPAILAFTVIKGAEFVVRIPYAIVNNVYNLGASVLATPAAIAKWAGEGIAGGISYVASGFIAQVVTKVSGDVSYTMLEKGREAVTEAIKQLTKDVTFNVLPYAVVGLTTIVGTPLLARYLYQKAIYNLGKPALAAEMHFAGLDSVTHRIKEMGSLIFSTVKSGAIWSLGAFVGLQVATAGAIGSGLYCMHRIESPSYGSFGYDLNAWGNYRKAIRSCYQSFLEPIDTHYTTALYAAPMIGFAAGAAWHLGCESWSAIKRLWNRYEPKPLFDKALSDQIDEIANATYNLQKNGGFYQNVLLYGPGGTGKTMVANAILKGVQKKGAKINWIKMTGASLAQYIKRGEHITELNRLFEQIKKSSHPTILFIDEIEALAMDRDKMDRSELFELIDTFLSHTGEPSSKFMIIGATNKKELVDPALLSRMDYKLKIHPPGVTERVRILTQEVKHFFSSKERQTLLNQAAIERLAKGSAGLTGRALCKMVNAIYAKKKTSKDGRLTKEMISSVLSVFVSQERAGLSFWTRALYASGLRNY